MNDRAPPYTHSLFSLSLLFLFSCAQIGTALQFWILAEANVLANLFFQPNDFLPNPVQFPLTSGFVTATNGPWIQFLLPLFDESAMDLDSLQSILTTNNQVGWGGVGWGGTGAHSRR